jgi:glycosyltransferase involved in cell wall biosynthesis
MNKYNVLFISPHVDNYGAERSLVAFMRRLQDDGNNVYLIILQHGKIEELLTQNEIRYSIVKFYQWTNVGQGTRLHYAIGKYIYNEYASNKIVKILKDKQFVPDIIHVNVVITELGVHLKRKLGAKLVWHIREICEAFNYFFDPGFKITSFMMQKADRMIGVSNAVVEAYKKYVPEEKIVRVYNGVEFCKPAEHDWNSEIFRILLVGRLSQEKGQIEAIKAIEKIVASGNRNIKLDLYGDGADAEKLSEYIQKNNLEDFVELMGYSNKINYDNYHIGLVCTKYEAFGRATVEYMMAGLSVIGADSGGTPELIKNNTGFIYQNGNIDELAEKILTLMNNRKLCEEMGKNALKEAQNYSVDNYYRGILEVYMGLFC